MQTVILLNREMKFENIKRLASRPAKQLEIRCDIINVFINMYQ